MAIKTGDIFKSLVFDGEDSRDYGVYITGEAVFDAPERDVEMIDIPGRNGSYALDNGRFHNITVTYPAGLFGNDEADFAQAISDFRNALCSRRGYCRLEDDYNPDEYRLAVYKSGLEVTPAQLKAGEFNIVFECKPQRFLKSGEEAIEVEDGDTLTNPTLFDASPLLMVDGYGEIEINGETISIDDDLLGDITLANPVNSNIQPFDASALNVGDSVTLEKTTGTPIGANFTFRMNIYHTLTSVTSSLISGDDVIDNYYTMNATGQEMLGLYVWFKPFTVAQGTTAYVSAEIEIVFTYSENGTTQTKSFTVKPMLAYNATTQRFTISYTRVGPYGITYDVYPSYALGKVRAYSTKSALGFPLYFDMDIGEAYKFEGDAVVSVNNAVSFPTKLPTLKPGANTVNFDNTVTDLKVVPHWWKV